MSVIRHTHCLARSFTRRLRALTGAALLSRQDQLKLSTDVRGSGELDGEDLLVRINFRLRLDEIADVETGHLRLSASRTPVGSQLRSLAYKIYKERRLRDQIVEEKLFGEPAWDMLLALYCLPARGELLTATSLTYAAEVPQATGVRWQRLLLSQGLIERGPDGVDGRKKFVRLTTDGRDLMHRVLSRLFYYNAPRENPLIGPHPRSSANS
jgi:DNA-binding MarR family transcriptional regulator